MAKTKNFYNEFNCTVTPKSKDTIYVYKGGNSTLCSHFNVDLTGHGNLNYVNFAYKQGNNLVIKTLFKDSTTHAKKKLLTTTVKNYFNGLLGEFDKTINICGKDCYIDKNTILGKNGLFAAVEPSTAQDYILASNKKNAKLTLSGDGEDYILDFKGDDEYTINQSDPTVFYEFNGNDKYSLNSGFSECYIYDYKGKDAYEAKITDSILYAYDYSGNDKYTADDYAKIYANDYKGNDKYYLYNSSASEVNDLKGNDKYTIENSLPDGEYYGHTITDSDGKDNYTITNSRGIQLVDKKGSDKYKIENIDTKEEYGKWNFLIADLKGNDRYELKNVSHYSDNLLEANSIADITGNDKYTLFTVKNASIIDTKGKDKYTVEQTEKLVIMENGGSDKYTIKDGSKNIDIKDQGGKDKYSFIGSLTNGLVSDIYIIDNGKSDDKYNFRYTQNLDAITKDPTGYRTIKDDGGNDTYKITNSAIAIIEDISGNDKYNFSATVSADIGGFMVYDNSGKDTYNINGTYDKKNKETHILNGTTINDIGANKDTYNINYAQNITIYDDGGKNKFNVKNSKNVTVTGEGNNTFNFKNVSKGSIISGSDYKDTYNINLSREFDIIDMGNTKDVYNIKNSAGNIKDYGGDDIYNISKMKGEMKIKDDGGNDILKLTDVKKKDIVFMASISEDDYEDNSLILFNKKTNGYICVDNYFSVSDHNITGKSDTAIETIKAGKSTLSVDFNFINQIKSDVSLYLGTGGSVMNVLQNQDTNAEALQDLIAYFTK